MILRPNWGARSLFYIPDKTSFRGKNLLDRERLVDSSIMDDLDERFRQLTVDYEKAVKATYIAFARVGPRTSSMALAKFQKALEQEEDIRFRRNEILNKVLLRRRGR